VSSEPLTPGPGSPPSLVGLQDTARSLGRWCWAERRCFEVLGGWVRDTPEPELKALFARHSRHHAWRADRWAEILPRAYVPTASELVTGGSDTIVFDLLGTEGPSANRLVAHYDVVYPALLAAYETSTAVMQPVTHGPALRATRIILGDAAHDLAEASSVVGRYAGGSVDSPVLRHLRHALAKIQVSGAEVEEPVSAFRRWGS